MNTSIIPFPVPTFQSTDSDLESFAQVLGFLRTKITEFIAENTLSRIPVENNEAWAEIVVGMSDHILASFPLPEGLSWDHAIHEKVTLVETTLEFIQQLTCRVDGILYGPAGLAKLFARLLNLCRVLDIWIDAETPHDDTISTPLSIKEKAFQVAVEMLRRLGGTILDTRAQQPPWKMLRVTLEEWLDLTQELVSQTVPHIYPLTISLSDKPRLHGSSDMSTSVKSDPVNIIIKSASQIPAFLNLLLDIMISATCPALPCQWFLSDLVRRISETARLIFDYCSSPLCSATSIGRIKALTKVIRSVVPLTNIPAAYNKPLTEFSYRLLQRRLNEGPKSDWATHDSILSRTFVECPIASPMRTHVSTILEALRMETWGAAGHELRALVLSYLRGSLQTADVSIVDEIKAAVSAIDLGQQGIAFIAELEKQVAVFNPTMDGGGENSSTGANTHGWQQKVRTLVRDIVAPDEVSWMDDDESLTDEKYAQRALQDVKNRFDKPLAESSSANRIILAERLKKLPCLLVTCDGSDCLKDSTQNGPENEVTAGVRRLVYSALSHVIMHHALTFGYDGLEHAILTIYKGIVDQNRSVRLSAGRALSALMRLYGDNGGDAYQQTEPIFTQLYRYFDAAKPPVKETLLIAAGSVGKTANVEVLGQALCFLVAQLGNLNPVIKGCASVQIVALAVHHQKSAYSLLLPYMDQIAPFLISRMCTQPSLLTEACRLMLISHVDLISTNLSRILPQLFASCELKVLESIAKDLETKPSRLVLDHSHEILAHVFLLPKPGHTNKALSFIVQILTDAAQNNVITFQSIVQSCVVPLLCELVISMGDENPDNAEMAVLALKKVERVLAATPKSRALPAPDLGAFLKTYMLGLISDINDVLQDVQGKKTVSMKRKILRSLGALVTHIGPSISNVAPQIMATFQTMVSIPELSEVTLESWHKFLITLGPSEIGPHVGPTSAAFVSSWPSFSPVARTLAVKSLEYIVIEIGDRPSQYLDDVVDLSEAPELSRVHERLQEVRGSWTPKEKLQRILDRSSSDNLTMAVQSLGELKDFMLNQHRGFVAELASGDIFDPIVGQIIAALFAAACRDGDGTDQLRLLAFECVGVLGAVDPDRCEITFNDPSMIMLSNFTDEGESVAFALHLIRDLLVGAFRSTSDIKYQSLLAYSIQELLQFCQFSPALVAAGTTVSVPLRVRNRWNSLPKHVLETVTPLLEARFKVFGRSSPDIQHPIYRHQSTYREWIQLWTTHLIAKASGKTAQTIFGVLHSAVRNKDVVVAHHVLPHLVLNILISGNEDDTQTIRSELLAVLEDQVDPESSSTADKKLLSAQAVFMLLDHLNKWVRIVRQDISTKKAESKRSRGNQIYNQAEEQLLRVDSILSSIDQNLMARAALECKAYARSLMNFESQIIALRERSPQNKDLPSYYERLHEIYSHLDEPDGMEGVSTLILSPSLEHQIRQHESTGHWTSAQSCWELRLQQSPDNVEFHLGLLRCLRNLGHYDTLRTHVRGVLTRNPDWQSALVGFQAESAWMVGAWDDVRDLIECTTTQPSSIVMARLLLAMRTGDSTSIANSLSAARSVLGAPITAAGVKGYRRSYEAVLDLHMTHELEIIHNTMTGLPTESQSSSQHRRRQVLARMVQTLSARLDSTLPTFRTREPILSMRRAAFALTSAPRHAPTGEIGRTWLASAKIARKAGQWQTAYSATLQAQQSRARFSFMESAKLIKATGEPLRALQELENSMRLLGLFEDQSDVLDLTVDDDETKTMKAKAQVLRARWMNESDRFEMNPIFNIFQTATNLRPNWESGHFHFGQFYDECFKNLSATDKVNRGLRMNLYTVRAYAKAIRYGSKYVYQTVPRLLTIWLDMGEDRNLAGSDVFKKLNDVVAKAIKDAPVYKWFTAFPQIVSRVGHTNPEVYKHLSKLIVKVMEEYPKQALWLFTSVVKSTKSNREQRGKQILDQLRNHPHNAKTQVPKLISQCVAMTNELLALCDYHIDDDSKKTLSMKKDFPRLAALGRSPLIIPLQESLTASLPPTSSSGSVHQPFPPNAPTFEEFFDEIDIMRSLAKPRKITIRGSNGQIYMFLGKPKDDLRKDARLMDFNAIINKLLKANSESRRRQLHIRTYGVVTLNEECGFIQWVPNTIPIRPVLVKGYDARRIRSWTSEMSDLFKKIKDASDKDAGEIYLKKILPLFPPVFHDWFIETFPEPSAWLASRLAYGRTAAVMSMVGFILGLGDRHCENILLDSNTGDVVHVDFNCLFEKGKTLETPERVPFRLTQNIIDGLGVTGVEGVFRMACEVTLQLLRDNKDSLMSVLDAFIHDPLVEWEDEKRKLEREPSRRNQNQVKASVDLRMLARGALNPIEKKLKGVYSTSKERHEKEISTSNLVQMLIQEATDSANLAKMYPGWASWH